MASSASVTPLLTLFTRWAAAREDVVAVALVGSYARDAARPDSDVDFMVLVSDPELFRRQTQWVYEIPWGQTHLQVATWADEDYGAAWSRRVILSSGLEIEIGFSSPQWAATDTCDDGTVQVVRDGCRILFDPSGILHRLMRAVSQQ